MESNSPSKPAVTCASRYPITQNPQLPESYYSTGAKRSLSIALVLLRRYYILICSRIFYLRNSVLTFQNLFNILLRVETVPSAIRVTVPVSLYMLFLSCASSPIAMGRFSSESGPRVKRSFSAAPLFMLNRLLPQILPRAGLSSSESEPQVPLCGTLLERSGHEVFLVHPERGCYASKGGKCFLRKAPSTW